MFARLLFAPSASKGRGKNSSRTSPAAVEAAATDVMDCRGPVDDRHNWRCTFHQRIPAYLWRAALRDKHLFKNFNTYLRGYVQFASKAFGFEATTLFFVEIEAYVLHVSRICDFQNFSLIGKTESCQYCQVPNPTWNEILYWLPVIDSSKTYQLVWAKSLDDSWLCLIRSSQVRFSPAAVSPLVLVLCWLLLPCCPTVSIWGHSLPLKPKNVSARPPLPPPSMTARPVERQHLNPIEILWLFEIFVTGY